MLHHAFLAQRFLHDVLRRDARVVGARQPQHLVPRHARAAREDVLDRVVQHMPEREHAGDIRRRDDDGIRGLRRSRVGGEAAVLLPKGIPLRLNGGGLVGFRNLGHGAFRFLEKGRARWRGAKVVANRKCKSRRVLHKLRLMTKRQCALLASVAVVVAFAVGWNLWFSGGIVMARSKCPHNDNTIVVRRFGDYQPTYLCEFYGSGQLISAQTHWSGDSASPAHEATVRWNQSGHATVSLDGLPVLELGKGCFWTDAKKR